jgi:hypothetical protein
MRFLDVGPEPIQVAGYRGEGEGRRPPVPGGAPPESTVSAFYDATRGRCFPAAYSVFALGAPIAVLLGAFGAAYWVLGPAAKPFGPNAPAYAWFCASDAAKDRLRTALAGAELHFALSHLALAIACALAYGFAVWAIGRVLSIHLDRVAEAAGWLGAAALGTFALGWAAYVSLAPPFGPYARYFFGSLKNFAHIGRPEAALPCLADAADAAARFDAQLGWGVLMVAVASAALAAAAAILAFRFEREDIDGRWADTYVLRHKLKALMTLFVFGSLVLVASNIGLSAYADLATGVASELAAAKADAKAPDAASPDAANPDANAAGRAASPIEPLRKTALNAIGALASLTLVGMFLPAFAGLSYDIELAGKTHAYAAPRPPAANPADAPPASEPIVAVLYEATGVAAVIAPEPPSPNLVAGHQAIEEWKRAHGLALEFSDVAMAMAAAVAPLLSNGVFDVAKSLFGPS